MEEHHFMIAIKPFVEQATIWWNGHNKIPENWEFDYVSVLEFKCFSIAVFAFNLFEITASLPENDKSIFRLYTPIYIITKDKLVHDVKKLFPKMSEDKIVYILEMLTYNNHIGDPLDCCPFIKFAELYITTPHIFSMLPSGEALMHHIPRNDCKFSSLTNEKESLQADKLIERFEKLGNVICSKKVLLPKPHPDIDLLVYCTTNHAILLLELKWFSGVTTIGKRCNKINSDIAKAVEQSIDVSDFISTLDSRKAIDLLRKKVPDKNSIKKIQGIYHAIVVDGVPDMFNENFPILSMETFFRVFDHARNFEEVVEYIGSGQFLTGDNYKDIASFYELEYAGIKFEIPCFTESYHIGRNDPCPCGSRKSNGTRRRYKDCCHLD